MTFEELLDPEVAPALEIFPPEMVAAIGDNPLAAREMFEGFMEQMAAMLPPTEVAIEERMIPGPDGDLRVVIYQPPVEAPRPGLLWIHGGGYIIGDARDDGSCVPHAEHTGCTIVSVDYRMAPEHPPQRNRRLSRCINLDGETCRRIGYRYWSVGSWWC